MSICDEHSKRKCRSTCTSILWAYSARFTHAACEKAEKWINKVERKINKIRCRKHSLPIAFLSCVCRGTKLVARLSTLVTSVSSTGRSNRDDQVQGLSGRGWRMCTFLTIFSASICSTIWFATMSSTTPSSSPQQSALYQALLSLAEVSKFSSHACSTARTHLERLQTVRRKENSGAANLADFALCCCNA